MSHLKPPDFHKALKAGKVSPVCLLYGEDLRAMDRALKELEETLLGQGVDEFNADYFDGREVDPGAVIAAARTLPMMSDRRLVVVRRAGDLKGGAREAVIEYFSSPNPSTVLVLSAAGLALKGSGARAEDKKLVEAAAKAGDAVNFARPSARALPQVIADMARERGKRIEPAAVGLFIDLAGDETLGIDHQLEKVILYVGDRDRISRDDVLEAVADVKEANVFEFTDAIGARDAEGALKSFRRMLDQGQEPLMILGMLLRHFRLLWKIREHVEGGQTPGQISKLVKLNEWVIKNSYLPQIRKFPDADTGRIARTLADLDIRLKSTRADREILFERTVINLCSGRL